MVILGVDEVGRGCWAGPLVVGAVALDNPLTGLMDSKLLTKLKRTTLAKTIEKEALACSLGWVTNSEIDELGLTKATTLAIKRALDKIEINFDEIIIDGNTKYLNAYNNKIIKYIIKADALIPAVSAASIYAKVSRDNYMSNLEPSYSRYNFAMHVGYGTKDHKTQIDKFGISDLHRISFKPIKEYLELNGKTA